MQIQSTNETSRIQPNNHSLLYWVTFSIILIGTFPSTSVADAGAHFFNSKTTILMEDKVSSLSHASSLA
ncbi:hypothetical protein EMCRGX_G016485 [Ephydatia muelleri]